MRFIICFPGVDAILAAIMAVSGDAGCLLIVKNYTGDRLNFGLAAEQARALGYKVEMVIVADDVALGRSKNARGIAGTVLVQKIAGNKAASGATLEEVTEAARDAATSVVSLGLALSDCNVFDNDHEPRLGDDEAELGLGIHGEPGAERIDVARLDELVERATTRLTEQAPDGDLAVMVNMLGAVPVIEAQAIVDALSRTALAERIKWIVGPAPIMTALDMNGFSFSLLPAKKEFVEALSAPVEPGAWPRLVPLEMSKLRRRRNCLTLSSMYRRKMHSSKRLSRKARKRSAITSVRLTHWMRKSAMAMRDLLLPSPLATSFRICSAFPELSKGIMRDFRPLVGAPCRRIEWRSVVDHVCGSRAMRRLA